MQSIKKDSVSSFDALVWGVAACLIIAIGVTILIGDRVGVRVLRMGPASNAHSTDPILLQFSEDMNRDSVIERFHVQPDVSGEFYWNATTLTFEPNQALQPGQVYTVMIEAGVESRNGRRLLEDYSFTFDIRTPHVAYLSPTQSYPQNVYISDPLHPESARQVTFSEIGIFDFSVSPDGRRIAYSEFEEDLSSINIRLLDLETSETQTITDCVDANCVSPVWRPDGKAIAYQRMDMNSNLPSVGVGATRIWLVELTEAAFNNTPLFIDSQIIGYTPVWSADGTHIAIYESSETGILVYDVGNESTQFFRSWNGTMGTLSADGTKLVFSDYDQSTSSSLRNYLHMADLATNEVSALTNLDDGTDDTAPVWHPNDRDVAFGRRYVDDAYSKGTQIYLLNTESGEVQALTTDSDYTNSLYSWDPSGTQLVLQRFQVANLEGAELAKTGVWTYNLQTGEMTLVASDAYLPRWVP